MKVKKEIAALERKLAYSEPKDDIKKAMDLLNYLPNGVASWVEAHGGDKHLAKQNGDKVKAVVQVLGEILASLPAAMSYHVYGLPQGTKEFDDRETLISYLKSQGIHHVGESPRGGSLRPELQGQPRFDKLSGPMYDGAGKVRYETAELNRALST